MVYCLSAGGSLSLGGFELACDAYSSTLDRRIPADDDDDDDDVDSVSPSPSASMSVMRDSFISNESPSAVLPMPFTNFFFYDSLATSSSGASNAAGVLHPPLQPVTYWNADNGRLPAWN